MIKNASVRKERQRFFYELILEFLCLVDGRFEFVTDISISLLTCIQVHKYSESSIQ